MLFLGYPKVIPYTKFEHFEIIRFWVMLQTNKQTDGPEHPTHADRPRLVWVTMTYGILQSSLDSDICQTICNVISHRKLLKLTLFSPLLNNVIEFRERPVEGQWPLTADSELAPSVAPFLLSAASSVHALVWESQTALSVCRHFLARCSNMSSVHQPWPSNRASAPYWESLCNRSSHSDKITKNYNKIFITKPNLFSTTVQQINWCSVVHR